MTRPPKHLYEFGHFCLDATERLLLRQGAPVSLTPKVFETLLVLAQNSGRLMEKDELMKVLWPDTIVDEANLTQNIFVLRKVLGEGSGEQKFIETVPKRGYRFVANVTERWEEETRAEDRESRIEDRESRIEDRESRIEDRAHSQPLVFDARFSAQASDLEPQSSISTPQPSILDPRSSIFNSRLPMLALLLVAVAAGVYYLAIRNQPRPAEAEGAIKSIAVLPFKPLGVEENEEVWALGLADALITRLSNLRQIVVRPTSAVLKYVGPDHDPVAVGRELGVDSVLDGKIQKVDDRLRVTVQLLSVRDGAPLWAETFDEQLTSVFAVEDSISAQVTQALILTLSGEEKRQLAKHSTESGEAYQLYLKGRYFWNKRSSEGLEKAIAHFEQAIERDPNYALAYAGLADAYSVIANAPLPQREALPKAREAALKALEIDDTLAEAHTSLAFVKFSYDWDWAGAEREFKRAHELNPNYATAHHWYAYYLIAMGRPDEALAEIRHAQALDPLSLIINTDVGDILAYARRYDEAVEQFRKTLDLDPNFTQAHFNLGLTLERMGQYEDAIAEFQKAIELSERNADMVAALGHVYAIVGRRAEAVAILDELNQRSKREYVLPYDRALIHLGLGQNGPALAWLQKDIDERVVWADRWTADARLDPVRSDPRFAELLRRVRLTDR